MRMQFYTIDAYVNSSNERAKLLSVYVIKSFFLLSPQSCYLDGDKMLYFLFCLVTDAKAINNHSTDSKTTSNITWWHNSANRRTNNPLCGHPSTNNPGSISTINSSQTINYYTVTAAPNHINCSCTISRLTIDKQKSCFRPTSYQHCSRRGSHHPCPSD